MASPTEPDLNALKQQLAKADADLEEAREKVKEATKEIDRLQWHVEDAEASVSDAEDVGRKEGHGEAVALARDFERGIYTLPELIERLERM